MLRSQRGLTAVEFAVAGTAAFIVLFGCLEVGRALFVWNTLSEATRLGARVAAVSDMTTPEVATAAAMTFGSQVSGLDQNDFTVQYLDAAGVMTATLGNVRYVRVSVSYTHAFLVPFFGGDIVAPGFATTLPSESLGQAGAS